MSEAIRPRSRLPLLVPVIAALVLLADQLSKRAAIQHLAGRGRVDVVDGVLWLHLTRNAGAAFSMATGATWLLTVVALVVVVAIIRVSRKLGSRGWALALGLLLGGALGNLSDRLFREPSFFHGHVIDFLEFPHWPIFNLADSSIVTAAVLIALLSLRGIGIDGRRVGQDGPAAAGPDSGPSAPSDRPDRSGVPE
jgi:signal peptidase II